MQRREVDRATEIGGRRIGRGRAADLDGMRTRFDRGPRRSPVSLNISAASSLPNTASSPAGRSWAPGAPGASIAASRSAKEVPESAPRLAGGFGRLALRGAGVDRHVGR